MATYEFERIQELTTREDALDAAAVAAGAANLTQLIGWLVKVAPPLSTFADFRNTNAASLAAAL